MAELSKNFDKQMDRRELPGCYGKYKETITVPKDATEGMKKAAKKKCGTCWFSHSCQAGAKRANVKGGGSKSTGKAEPAKTDDK